MTNRWLAVSALSALVALSTLAGVHAQGTAFTYQGYLRQSGTPVNANHDFQFSLWTALSGGSQVGSTLTRTNVEVRNGLFTVPLDFGAVWDGSDRFLQIAVRPAGSGSYTTLAPRVKINPTPYAIRAGVANPIGAAGGDLSGSYPNPTVAQLQGRSVSSSAPSSGQVLKWNGTAWVPAADDVGGLTLPFSGSASVGSGAVFQVTNTAASGLAYGVFGSSASTSGRGVFGAATAASGETYGVYGSVNSPNGWAGYFSGRGYFSSSVGIGTTLPAAPLDIRGGNWDTASTEGDLRIGSASYRLKLGISTDGGGAGHATITAQGGVNALSLGAGTTLATQRTLTILGTGQVGIGTATPIYRLHVEDGSSPGRALYGIATATSGIAIGVWGQSASPYGRGVMGWATATNGENYGGYFSSAGTSGTGVYGRATATSGVTYGVLGQSLSPAGYGVYSQGAFAATGTKSFQMDHPLSPETHYLNHFCTESPEPMNTYSGNVVTDAQGYATITLPAYFESINRDCRYQLTVIDDSDDFVLAKVVRKIQNNQFVIRTSKPFVEVSWRVEAVRNDLWVQRYGFQTEQEKEDEIKGKYLHPELYGQPKERGIHYQPEPEPAPNETTKP